MGSPPRSGSYGLATVGIVTLGVIALAAIPSSACKRGGAPRPSSDDPGAKDEPGSDDIRAASGDADDEKFEPAGAPPIRKVMAERVCAPVSSGPTELLSALFVGNSYTAYNDLPGLVESLGEASPTPVSTDSITAGSARVIDHLANPKVIEALSGDWSVIVIQGQSLEPILDYPTFEAAVVDFAELSAKAGDPRVLLYQTWPRGADNLDLVVIDMSVDEMLEALVSSYTRAALASGTEVAPVGEAWMFALRLDPQIELHATDGSHPSLAGSYLAACVFFGKLVERGCETSDYIPAKLPTEQAEQLRHVADVTNGLVDHSQTCSAARP